MPRDNSWFPPPTEKAAKLPVLVALVLSALLFPACSRSRDALAEAHRNPDPASCQRCHSAEYASWAGSHHALAQTALSRGDPPYPPAFSHPSGWLGVSPLKQLLIPFGSGRTQVSDLAYATADHTWFNVFGSDVRQPGDWGHWTGRGMNWNSNCAWCHNTTVAKGYHADTDSYATTMAHMGVACAACHGDGSHALSPAQAEAACAACHARREELDGAFRPGDAFDDHFSLMIVDDTDAYYPDGQVKDEDFEYAAFLGSKMHAAGVSCINCHDPHSGLLRAEGNSLCLTCHAGGNKSFPTAPVIQPELHSHHLAGGAGDLCVNCHMPVTVYMQRHPRRDHGFTIPDPMLTRLIGVPNACNRCHADKATGWAEAAVDRWFGAKMARPTRDRALLLAAARAGAGRTADGRETLPALIAEIAGEKSGYWRAAAAGFLGPASSDPAAAAALGRAMKDPEPIVRERAILASTGDSEGKAADGAGLSALLADPSRSVRIQAAWDLRDQVDTGSLAGRDLLAFLEFNRDQPTGAYRLGTYLLGRGKNAEATAEFEKAARWDPLGPQFRGALAVAYSLDGRPLDAVAQLREGCRLAPKDAELRYQLGLALNETGDLAGAADALEQAASLDPNDVRILFNLGAARMKQGRWEEAVEALKRADALQPGSDRIQSALAQAQGMLENGK